MENKNHMHKRLGHNHHILNRADIPPNRILSITQIAYVTVGTVTIGEQLTTLSGTPSVVPTPTITPIYTLTHGPDGNSWVQVNPASSTSETPGPTTTTSTRHRIPSSKKHTSSSTLQPVVVLSTLQTSPISLSLSGTSTSSISTTHSTEPTTIISPTSTTASSTSSTLNILTSTTLSSSSVWTSQSDASAVNAISPSESATGAAVVSKANTGNIPTGVFAGIIGGAVGVVLLVLGLFALLYRKRQNRNANYTKPEDEKGLTRMSAIINPEDRYSPPPTSPISTTPAKAPRLSLRPMTNFMPGLEAVQGVTNTSKQADPYNNGQSSLALNEKDISAGNFAMPQPSPALSTFSDVGVQGGNPSPVHRVMIDFSPSMGDELALKTGDLVKMLHEYDDGWALCIRLDRSQQGVCPRTCLSQRPVKPRSPPGSGGPRVGDKASNVSSTYSNAYPNESQQGDSRSSVSPTSGRPLIPGSPGRVSPQDSAPQNQQNRGGPPSQNRPSNAVLRPGPGAPRSLTNSSSALPRADSPGLRGPHPLSRMQRDDEMEPHAM